MRDICRCMRSAGKTKKNEITNILRLGGKIGFVENFIYEKDKGR